MNSKRLVARAQRTRSIKLKYKPHKVAVVIGPQENKIKKIIQQWCLFCHFVFTSCHQHYVHDAVADYCQELKKKIAKTAFFFYQNTKTVDRNFHPNSAYAQTFPVSVRPKQCINLHPFTDSASLGTGSTESSVLLHICTSCR